MKNLLWIRTHIDAMGNINRFAMCDIKKLASDGRGGIDLGIIYPMPDGFDKSFEDRYESVGAPYGTEAWWRFQTWGCNWNPVNAVWKMKDGGFSLEFDTVDKPPLPWVETFCQILYQKFGAESNGLYAPDVFGNPTMGSFEFYGGVWTEYDILESGFNDNAQVVKSLWGLTDEDVAEWRGFAHNPPMDEKTADYYEALRHLKRNGATRQELDELEAEYAEELSEDAHGNRHKKGFWGRLFG